MKAETISKLKALFPGSTQGTLRVRAQENALELSLYGVIEATDDTGKESQTSATYIKKVLDQYPDVSTIRLHISSPGGYVLDGTAIYTLLKRHKAFKEVFIDGCAASVASLIAMAGDTVTMGQSAYLMIHNPWLSVAGNAAELRKTADDLDKIAESMRKAYLSKAGDKLTESRLIQLLDAETFLTAEDAKAYGLCDCVEDVDAPGKEQSDGWLFAETADRQERAEWLVEELSHAFARSLKKQGIEVKPAKKKAGNSKSKGWFF